MQALRSAPQRLPKTNMSWHRLISTTLDPSTYVETDVSTQRKLPHHTRTFFSGNAYVNRSRTTAKSCARMTQQVYTPPRRKPGNGLLPVSPTATLSFHNIKRPEKFENTVVFSFDTTSYFYIQGKPETKRPPAAPGQQLYADDTLGPDPILPTNHRRKPRPQLHGLNSRPPQDIARLYRTAAIKRKRHRASGFSNCSCDSLVYMAYCLHGVRHHHQPQELRRGVPGDGRGRRGEAVTAPCSLASKFHGEVPKGHMHTRKWKGPAQKERDEIS